MDKSWKPNLDGTTWLLLNPKPNLNSRFYSLPKIHKPNVPIRPTIDFTNAPTHRLSKFACKMLRPLQSNSHRIHKNSMDFINHISSLSVENDEIMAIYDIASLFTSLSIISCLDITRCLLLNDSTLRGRCNWICGEILQALELCPNSTLFTFQGWLYRQTDGIAIGPPLFPIIANIFMSHFEEKILSTYTLSPKALCRFVDDIFVMWK